jgi:hypothetical protein
MVCKWDEVVNSTKAIQIKILTVKSLNVEVTKGIVLQTQIASWKF